MDQQTKICYRPVPFTRTTIDDAFWAPLQRTNHETTLQIEYKNLQRTGHIDALRLDWQAGDPNPPHIFWESDLAKWLEAACCVLAQEKDAKLAAQVDEVVDLLAGAQQPDGYLNAHFTVVEPEQRWTNLRDRHELYCAGHLIEAAIAHYEATGQRTLLNVMIRYADYIDSVFGRGENQLRGYPGHQEIELALVKLYRTTGEARYLDLAQYFIDERGRQPHYFDQEARARGEDPQDFQHQTYEYNQSHKTVREQDEAVGHSVRALYLYCAMADLALENDDQSLLAACRRLYKSVQRRLYITGGVGSSRHNEGWTADYDLPNEEAYAETCASIALIFWMQRLLRLELNGSYGDTLERALYNGFLSGISLDGSKFFYVNPLAVHRDSQAVHGERHTGQRQSWFGCACCPPNVARLLASLGDYIYGENDNEAVVHLYIGGSAQLQLGERQVTLTQQTDYPWAGTVSMTVTPDAAAEFRLALRIPGWCKGHSLQVNGEEINVSVERGYARIHRRWQPGDEVLLTLDLSTQRVYADPRVRADAGRVALQRGPVVYCLEGVDNGDNLDTLQLPSDAALDAEFAPDLLGGVVRIELAGERAQPWDGLPLYHTQPPATSPATLSAVPYYAWANRATGDMLIWLREA